MNTFSLQSVHGFLQFLNDPFIDIETKKTLLNQASNLLNSHSDFYIANQDLTNQIQNLITYFQQN